MTGPSTKQRILEVAAEVYAEKGFRNVRVRDICERAGANVAAVNYHFGDKQSLYNEVLRYAFFSVAGGDSTQLEFGGEGASPQERLRAFVRYLIGQLLTEGRSALFAKLVARELVDPTHALDRVIEEGMRPQVEALISIIRDLLGERADDRFVRRCAGSILAQCIFYYFARPVIQQIPLEEKFGPELIDDVTDHVTRFSLAALGQFAEAEASKIRRQP